MLTNKNFLNNPTDALADGLISLRKEAAEKLNVDKNGKSIGKGKDESKENDGSKDKQ